jgi:hypothetical protein
MSDWGMERISTLRRGFDEFTAFELAVSDVKLMLRTF